MSRKNQSKSLILSPSEVYDSDVRMEDFVLQAVNKLIIKKRRKNPADNIALDRDKLKSVIKKAARERGREYDGRWLKNVPPYIVAAGWHVDITSWGYSLTPSNLQYQDDYGLGEWYDE